MDQGEPRALARDRVSASAYCQCCFHVMLLALGFRSSLSIQNRAISFLHTRRMSSRSYREAIDALNSLQTNAGTLEALRASGGKNSNLAIPEMIEYLRRIGYQVGHVYFNVIHKFLTVCQPDDLNRLNVIHITGTKGKGSTSAFTDSILRHAMPAWNVGTKLRHLGYSNA